MARPIMTYKLAMAAGQDAANRNMRAAGRTAWNTEDYDIAIALTDQLLVAAADDNYRRMLKECGHGS